MTPERQNELLDVYCSNNGLSMDLKLKMKAIITHKRHDYCPDDDILMSFKKVALMSNLGPQIVCDILINTKIVRLDNLKHRKKPNFESIEDNEIDLENYKFLKFCLENE